MAKASKHERLCEDAKAAINDVHSDTSVPASTTLRSLQDLRDHTNVLIEAVENDLGDDGDEDD